MSIAVRVLLSVIFIAPAPVALGQASAPAAPEPGSELTISVLTMQPGDAIWEKFGHNAIRVEDALTGLDAVYNWGMFDFEQEHFFRNYMLGHMRYWVEAFDGPGTVEFYAVDDRTVWSQELNLSPAQRLRLRDFLAWNERLDNRYYDYNYFTDNCSTRVRDAVDLAVNQQLSGQLKAIATETTYRWQTRRLTQGDVFWYTALNTALGPASDRRLSAWETCFLPMKLRDYLGTATIVDEHGQRVPLVKAERVLYQGHRPSEPDRPPRWIVLYLAAGLAVAVLLAALGHLSRSSIIARGSLGILATCYCLAIGICGLIGLWFWCFTAHWAAWRNENLFAYSPLALLLAVAFPMAFRRATRWRNIAVWLAAAVAASTLIGIAVQALPWFDQVNGEPLALVAPVNFALALITWRYLQTSTPRTAGDAKDPQDL